MGGGEEEVGSPSLDQEEVEYAEVGGASDGQSAAEAGVGGREEEVGWGWDEGQWQ